MDILLWVWFGILCAVGLMWLSRHVEISRAHRDVVTLRPCEPPIVATSAKPSAKPSAEPIQWPAVSLLIAAKDEERVIEACVRSVLTQDYAAVTGQPFELIIINDRSKDRTAEIVQGIIDEPTTPPGRVRLLTIAELKPGWFGKNNAMDEGVKLAAGNMLCFSDADCRFLHPSAIRVAVEFQLREKIDFLSVLPDLERGTFWEQVVQPVAGGVMVYWFHPKKVNSPRRSNAYANGAFMSMPRAVYDRLGGHEPVKTEVNEDVHMARRAKQMGLRLFVTKQNGLYICRMYTGFRQIWRGWSRIFYGCFGTMPKLIVSLIFLLLFSIGPWVSLLAGLLKAAIHSLADLGPMYPAAHWVVWASVAVVLLQMSVIARFHTLSNMSPIWAPTWPLGAVICAGMTINAMLTKLGYANTNWRGTVYRADQVVQS